MIRVLEAKPALRKLIKSYSARHTREEFNRMVEWAKFCLDTSDEEQRAKKYVELFGEKDRIGVAGESQKSKLRCHQCFDSGWFFSWECSPNQRNVHDRKAEGLVTCFCPIGRNKDAAIKQHGSKEKRFRRKGDVR